MRATVNVEYETGSSEESQDKYDPAVSATLNMQRSEESTGPGAAIGGVPGTSSNVAAAKPVAPAAPGAPPHGCPLDRHPGTRAVRQRQKAPPTESIEPRAM